MTDFDRSAIIILFELFVLKTSLFFDRNSSDTNDRSEPVSIRASELCPSRVTSIIEFCALIGARRIVAQLLLFSLSSSSFSSIIDVANFFERQTELQWPFFQHLLQTESLAGQLERECLTFPHHWHFVLSAVTLAACPSVNDWQSSPC